MSLFLHGTFLSLPLATRQKVTPVAFPGPTPLKVQFERPRPLPQVTAVSASPAPSLAPHQVEPEKTDDLAEAPSRPGVPLSTRYFKSNEVDQRAEPIEMGVLIYPEQALVRRIPGIVSLRAFLDETGTIDAIEVIESHPQGMFERAAIDAVLNTRFAPARRLGQPVKNVKTIEIRFDPYQDLPPAPANTGRN